MFSSGDWFDAGRLWRCMWGVAGWAAEDSSDAPAPVAPPRSTWASWSATPRRRPIFIPRRSRLHRDRRLRRARGIGKDSGLIMAIRCIFACSCWARARRRPSSSCWSFPASRASRRQRLHSFDARAELSDDLCERHGRRPGTGETARRQAAQRPGRPARRLSARGLPDGRQRSGRQLHRIGRAEEIAPPSASLRGVSC